MQPDPFRTNLKYGLYCVRGAQVSFLYISREHSSMGTVAFGEAEGRRDTNGAASRPRTPSILYSHTAQIGHGKI